MSVIVCLLAAVTILRWFVDGAGQAAALLYVVPIALGALRFGRRGGVAVAGFGMAAFITFELLRAKGDLDFTGWAAPLLAMALVGGMVGHLSDVAARSEAERKIQVSRVNALRDAQYETAEASDSIVQRVAAARWMLEAGQRKEALAALDEAVAQGVAHVTGTLPPVAPSFHGDGGTAGEQAPQGAAVEPGGREPQVHETT